MANTNEEISRKNEMPIPKIKHDWYQTETSVIVSILAKNTENVKVCYNERTLSVGAKLPTGSDYSLELDLAHEIMPEYCTHKICPSKIEIKLKKRDGLRWTVLEGSSVVQEDIQAIPQEFLQTSNYLKYPSSSKKSKDWDKVEHEIKKEEEEEKPEGDAAVNALFQKIYSGGSDEVRRAMNKSFQESGGTVLSTNWSEVGSQTVECRPPEGVELKTWS
ncbi:hypothetical protein PV327_004987 [Microctonus hyperodae]|uniref:Suppressor of G2 allele of SKP1 n=1 Tax=Microctonus hyperodae TaxID=165561 RepID=A0AA39FDL5_MICHY|nr:hypothetical protein PV327_004987 [Microctonus hyperodae]